MKEGPTVYGCSKGRRDTEKVSQKRGHFTGKGKDVCMDMEKNGSFAV